MNRTIVQTKDGSHSLFVPELNEHYHSGWGALTESKHVFIEAGLKAIRKHEIRIFEMGFGTGLNALLTFNEMLGTDTNVLYTTIEQFPLNMDEIDSLNYPELINPLLKPMFKNMHTCDWNTNVKLSKTFTLKKIAGNLREITLMDTYDLIYFDAFAPDKQPELWSEEIFKKLLERLETDGIITTYTAKGDVRRCWQKLGLTVDKVPGPPGKREFLRGKKIKS